MLISTFCNILYVVKPSVGFETNRNNDAGRKYHFLLNDLSSKYHCVKFVNLSKGFLGVFGQSRDSFNQFDLGIQRSRICHRITPVWGGCSSDDDYDDDDYDDYDDNGGGNDCNDWDDDDSDDDDGDEDNDDSDNDYDYDDGDNNVDGF